MSLTTSMPTPTFSLHSTEKLAIPYFRSLQADGLVKYAFCEGDVHDLSSWMEFLRRADTKVLFVAHNDQAIGHLHLNNWMGYAAMAHFSCLRAYHRYAAAIGESVWGTISQWTRTDGTPYLKTVYGLTPVWNKAAVRFLKKVGFEQITIVPESSYIACEGVFSDSILSVRTLQVRRSTQVNHG